VAFAGPAAQLATRIDQIMLTSAEISARGALAEETMALFTNRQVE
jgi:hypothetical protein